MLNTPTVLVLGAGASFDFGMPLGSTLAASIRSSLAYEWDIDLTQGDRELLNAYRGAGNPDIDPFVQAAMKIAAALPSFKSIDDCLHSHSHNQLGVLAGKMAIARQIMLAEQNSGVARLWGSRQERETGLAEARRSWAGALVQLLVTGVAHAEYQAVFRNLTVVSFNYDRIIESILFHLIQPALDITPQQAAEAMAGLRVFHPYGSLGQLPIQDTRGVPFGPHRLDLVQATQGLFVYTEGREEPEDYSAMRQAIADAGHVVFLGFGFHEQNVGLLHSSQVRSSSRAAFGTVTGEPAPAIRIYKERVQSMLNTNGAAHLTSIDCQEFMRDYAAVIAQ